MKNSIKSIFALGLLTLAMTANADVSPVTSSVDLQGATTIELQSVESAVSTQPINALSVEVEQGLIFMREEEKLARDVYLALYDVWGLNIFENIAKSEQSHMDAILKLIEKYALADPVTDDSIGVYTNYEFVEMYEDLVAMGSESLEHALQVGIIIEELDIKDINEMVAEVDGNDDVVSVYQELLKGSRNHLRAFWELFTSKGGSYEPQFISQSEFDAIVSSPMERGNLH